MKKSFQVGSIKSNGSVSSINIKQLQLIILGAIHSYLGSLDTRATENGTKISCVHFQCAAGFFQYISDHLDTTLSPDISQFMLKLYINTMLVRICNLVYGYYCFNVLVSRKSAIFKIKMILICVITPYNGMQDC